MTSPADQFSPSPSQPNVVTIELPEEFWNAIRSLAMEAGVTPETVLSAGTSLFSLALKAKAHDQKLAVIDADQPCITEIKGL